MKAVLIVIEGGVADVRYVPPDVAVCIKDYDVQGCAGDEQCCDVHQKDTNGDDYHLSIEKGPVGENDPEVVNETLDLLVKGS